MSVCVRVPVCEQADIYTCERVKETLCVRVRVCVVCVVCVCLHGWVA